MRATGILVHKISSLIVITKSHPNMPHIATLARTVCVSVVLA
jgi:hypothetical protein